jgi:hypothetical protein
MALFQVLPFDCPVRKRSAGIMLVAAGLLLLPVGAGASKRPSAAELAAITERGRLLAGYDAAAWHSTDAVLATHPKEGSSNRYIAHKTETGWVVDFGKLSATGDRFLVVSEAVQAGAQYTVKSFDPARVDEASMVSTRQMHAFLERLNRHDRVLFVGDVRQHEAVEAGRPYAQMQEAGMRTARLDEILRQKDPELKQTVEQLARGEVKQAVENLNYQGRVHEFKNRAERIGEIAREYARSPKSTLVISPDNESRREINSHIHRAMRQAGQVTGTEYRVPVLHARQELTGADRQHAQNYTEGDVIRFSKGSKPLGIEPGEYARVARVDEESNKVTITRKSGEELSYDPRRLQGVTVYRDGERVFAQGDRVQMTAPYQEQRLANRELGTLEKIDVSGNLKVKMDSGREVEFNVRQMPHLDYGYAVTSHSSQGQTADRVLVHVDSEQAHGELLNSRMAYVSVSRAQFDVQMYLAPRFFGMGAVSPNRPTMINLSMAGTCFWVGSYREPRFPGTRVAQRRTSDLNLGGTSSPLVVSKPCR